MCPLYFGLGRGWTPSHGGGKPYNYQMAYNVTVFFLRVSYSMSSGTAMKMHRITQKVIINELGWLQHMRTLHLIHNVMSSCNMRTLHLIRNVMSSCNMHLPTYVRIYSCMHLVITQIYRLFLCLSVKCYILQPFLQQADLQV